MLRVFCASIQPCNMLCSLGYLVQRVQPDKADKILDTLCTRLVAGKKEADRESASISLKSTILDLPGETAKGILKHVVPKLLQGTQTKVLQTMQSSVFWICRNRRCSHLPRSELSIGLSCDEPWTIMCFCVRRNHQMWQQPAWTS